MLTESELQQIRDEAEKVYPIDGLMPPEVQESRMLKRVGYIAALTSEREKINRLELEVKRLQLVVANMSKEYNELWDESRAWKEESGN